MFAIVVDGFCNGQKELRKKVNKIETDINNSLQEINLRLDSIEKGKPLIGDINVNINGVVGGNTGDQPQDNVKSDPGGSSALPPISGTVVIETEGSLSKSAVINYIKSVNPAASGKDTENLIDTYFEEAKKEGINHDLAIAQMLYVTNNLIKKSLTNVHNYAGFNVVNNMAVSFNNMTDGVRAHIQHLKGYSSKEELKSPLVDPRWKIIERYRGTVKTLDDLASKWNQANPSYARKIVSIINNMRRFS